MSWQTPKTTWLSTDKMNIADLNRIEGNTQEIETLLASFRTDPTLSTIKTDWGNDDFPYYDELNRIEGNILALENSYVQPTGWITPKTDWATGPIGYGYTMANRIETDLLLLYNSVTGTINNFLKCGTFKCGSDRIRQHFTR